MATTTEPGIARSSGISYQELLDTDTHPVPEVLRLEAPRYLGDEDIPVERYTSREWHEREVERLWKRVWQFACREEEIQQVGSYALYEIANLSFIVMRTAPDRIQAFHNVCLHRGRQLRDYDGRCSELRCPYHGFAWNIDGSLKYIPAPWDFPHIVAEQWSLREARVGTWAGFVFINPDPGAAPLEELLSDMPSHFERWNLADRFIEGHVAKVINANWKVTQEAFSEAFHAGTTHPQTLPYLGDVNSQVDVWDTYSRVITPGGTASPNLRWEPTEEEILRYMLDTRVDEEVLISLKPGDKARTVSAGVARERWRPVVGDLVDEWSDAEFIDNLDYTLFPNFHPWGAFNRITYRFRPNGDDHRSSIMDVYLLAPFSGERPPPRPTTWLDSDESWTNASELGMLGKVFDQDSFNMSKVQKGMEQRAKPGLTLANYQESKVRWHHQLLEKWLEED
jgi:phenylpropionate dioxygenase-like ring-hydroxylating dioxygenase large terminal subunit